MQQAGVVKLLVGIFQGLKNDCRLGVAVCRAAGKLVGERQAKQAERQLVIRIDGQDVAADRFRLFRLVQRAVQLNLGDRLGNAAL